MEPRIAPLVFELKRMGVFQPCWSCEGHSNPDGSLWKPPGVWLYAESDIHVRMLFDCLTQLRAERRLAAEWELRVTFSAPNNLSTTYALQPCLGANPPGLDDLRADIELLAEELRGLFLARADSLRATGAAPLGG